MGIEALNNAAWAAGFAMAADDLPGEEKPEVKTPATAWQTGGAVLRIEAAPALAKGASTPTEWVKGVFYSFGRRAPA
jgi:hypothetical protein